MLVERAKGRRSQFNAKLEGLLEGRILEDAISTLIQLIGL